MINTTKTVKKQLHSTTKTYEKDTVFLKNKGLSNLWRDKDRLFKEHQLHANVYERERGRWRKRELCISIVENLHVSVEKSVTWCDMVDTQILSILIKC